LEVLPPSLSNLPTSRLSRGEGEGEGEKL